MDPLDYPLFVYGTLRRQCPSGAHRRWLSGARYAGQATLRGQLYLIETYPGLVLDGDTPIAGELYYLPNLASLHALDRYEGCGEQDPAPQEYQRRLLPVTTASGQTHNAWVYVYNWPLQPQHPLIPSGDFLRRPQP